MKLYLILIILITSVVKSNATTYESEGWFALFAKKPIIENKYSIWQEVQLRYDFEKGEMSQSMLRFGILKSLNKHHEVGLLMGYIATGSSSKEYRPTLQHTYSKTTDNIFYSLRTRMEWRDLENNSSNSIRLRFNPSFRWKFKERISFVISDETFFNLTKETWTGDRIFERNRFFVGLRHDFLDFQFEYGYLNQYIPRRTVDTVDHVLVFNFYY